MRVTYIIVVFFFFTGVNGQVSDVSLENSTIPALIRSNELYSNLSQVYDPQISGFNSTKVASGPIVLADKRTLFVSNIQYNGPGNSLTFWAGYGSPYSQPQFVSEVFFPSNHTNVYVTLPATLTLDTIDFFGVGLNETLLDYVIFSSVNRSRISDNVENTKAIYRIPKCCPQNSYLLPSGCIDDSAPIDLDVKIFESNETGLDPDLTLNASEYELRPYFYQLSCFRIPLETEVHGLIYNSSLIVQGLGIKSHNEFCVDASNYGGEDQWRTVVLMCFEEAEVENTPDINVYLPVLIISTICFALSAGAYAFILRVKDIHKKCFIVFSSSMCVTFLSLIILQVQSNDAACALFGFVFIFSTVLSFTWLCIICLDLLYDIKYPLEKHRDHRRWYWYIGISLAISFLMLLISLFSGELFVPDVPKSFIKNYDTNKCQFSTKLGRISIVFVPIGLSILLSIVSLITSRQFFRKNERIHEIRNTHDWIENRNNYKFLSRTYVIIISVAFFWLLNLGYNFLPLDDLTQLALDVIEASLGVVTLSGFVFNKYTWAEIRQKLSRKRKKITEEALGLNGFPTPDSPLTPESDTNEPLYHPMNKNVHYVDNKR